MPVDFMDELRRREQRVVGYFSDPRFRDWFRPEHLQRAVYAYIERPGKRLRPAVLLFSCGAVGGDEDVALPAAAGIELFHTWTLVHDDVIDHDLKRRGGPTVHEQGRQMGAEELGLQPAAAIDYGNDLAILAGDVQQGWSVCLFAELAAKGVPPEVVLSLIARLESHVLNELIRGELLDVQFATLDLDSLQQDAIIEMLWLKTGILYEFAAMAGAMIGLATPDTDDPTVQAIGQFAAKCGTAFQLQDDILGLVGDERALGKPVGSDVREGKGTTIVYHAFRQAKDSQREFLKRVLGNRQADDADVAQVMRLLRDLGGVEYTNTLAKEYIAQALPCLDGLRPSPSKELLLAWAHFMIEREF
ncbi:MAG: polyprenyl synthetase family protein [Phycisphaerae bacterium]|nr:polyprenyl synthetase family protein [Phycisphaerae bacterium]